MSIVQAMAEASAGCITNFRIEYFRDGILIKACPSHRSKEEAIELSRRFWKIAGNGSGRLQQVFGPEQ